jgi:hypothetical protein
MNVLAISTAMNVLAVWQCQRNTMFETNPASQPGNTHIEVAEASR